MTEVIDRAVLAALAESVGAEFVAELIDTFTEEAPTMLAELRQALLKHEVDGFRRVAHSLKTNANTFGATQLAMLARDMEMEARANSLPASGRLDGLEESYQVAVTELEFYKQALATKGSIQ